MLHGFGQTCRCWGPLASALARDHEVVRLDAPGHGRSAAVRADLGDTAALLADQVGPAVYLGYSMGARMALQLALDRPEVVRRLVLVGGTAGIDDPSERAARRERDRELAERIRRHGVDAFVRSWLDQPLFARLPAHARFDDERRTNTPDGLVSSLELAGTGVQLPRWTELHRLDMPVLTSAGEDDLRYAGLAQRMARAIGPNADVVLIPRAGHAAHLERPEVFVAELRSWLG
jgi:2-succinyl-6-hydroxy-2,4-cyclohexadiene-1-carboxylate synthase